MHERKCFLGVDMPLRELNFEEVKEVLIDPWHVLVVDALGGNYAICTYGEGESNCEIVEEVEVDNDTAEQLSLLSDAEVIYYDSLDTDSIKQRMPMAHFFDLFREYAYGKQPDDAYAKALSLGLVAEIRQ